MEKYTRIGLKFTLDFEGQKQLFYTWRMFIILINFNNYKYINILLNKIYLIKYFNKCNKNTFKGKFTKYALKQNFTNQDKLICKIHG